MVIEASRNGYPASSIQRGYPYQGIDYLSLLLKEMRHQDPLEPLGSKDFMGQLLQMGILSEIAQIKNMIEGLVENGGQGDQSTRQPSG